jgi:RNA polymerase sigma factor (sigma-70 family)
VTRRMRSPGTAERSVFDDHRGLLVGVAYRLLGSLADAEDVVQETWLRSANVDYGSIHDPRAFLVRVTTRLGLDRLRRIKARREDYIGPWLPEPVLTTPDIAEEVERAETISLALIVVLETLSPLERAVFVLHEVFDFAHPEIADVLGRSEVAVRQLAARARSHVQARRPRFEADRSVRLSVTQQFLSACSSGDLTALLGVLSPGVTLINDGGGQKLAARLPVRGASAVSTFLLSISRGPTIARYLDLKPGQPLPPVRATITDINGGPGIILQVADRPIAVLSLDIADGVIQLVRLISSPAKLSRLTTSAHLHIE